MATSLRSSVAALVASGVAAALAACDGSSAATLTGTPASAPTAVEAPVASGAPEAGLIAPTNPGAGGVTPGTGGDAGNGADPTAGSNVSLDERQVSYGEALRTASLKLLGDLPTLAQINAIAQATDPAAQQALYASFIDQFLADPRFAPKMIQYFRDTFKTGATGQGAPGKGQPSFDTAATFAAEVVVTSQPYTTLFTATSGTCPTYADGKFTPADCGNGAPTAGILTDPGLMAQYYADLSFRRVRFIQETFVCSKFPAEYAPVGKPLGAGTYTSPWDFGSITGGAKAKIDFQDTTSIVCANCHTTLNHIAPLFGHFDQSGQYDPAAFHVNVPVPGTPAATLADWLPPGQGFAWRDGTPVTDIPGLGKAIAADPDVALCAVNRFWDFAMGRGDIVNDLATVPPVVTQPFVAGFSAGGMDVKRLLRAMFTSDDFVKF